jgi:hypothetical protein
MRIRPLFLALAMILTCRFATAQKAAIDQLMDQWHQKASLADSSYFDDLGDGAIFIGTDPTERWDKPSFMNYGMPFFRQGKAWSFNALERHVTFENSGKIAWADELLATQMGLCRATAVLTKTKKGWKIMHYQLSVAMPNALMKDYLTLKARKDSLNASAAVKVVEQQLQAYNKRDLNAFLETFSDSAALYRWGNATPVAKGRAELEKLYGALFESSPNLNSRLISRVALGPKVIDHEWITGRAGQEQGLELLMLYEVNEGKIISAYRLQAFP